MPRLPPPEHTRWQKGQSGNPKGYQGDPPELKAIKKLTKAELVDIGTLVVKGDVASLKAIAKNEKASVLRVMIAAVAVKVIQKGDMHALDVLLNRLIGKVKDEILHQGDINLPQVIVTLPDNGRKKPEDDGYGF